MENETICIVVIEYKGITYSVLTHNRERAVALFKEFNTGREEMNGMTAVRELEDFTDIHELRNILHLN